jgi:hypothetical protein
MALKKFYPLLLTALFLITSCASLPSPGEQGSGRMPAWVNSVDSVYPRAQYVAATGYASSRAEAEGNALNSLTAFFGQTVQVDRTLSSSYRQAVTNGVTDGWIDTVEMNSIIKTSVSMDNLMGVEIMEVWFDSRGIYYAVAVMEKARAIRIYNELIQANLNIINNLVTMTPNERNSLNGVIRYRFAAEAADVNVTYGNIIRLLDAQPPEGIVSGDRYRIEAQNIVRTIPIGIMVTNDRSGRIFGAFARRFSDMGFESTASVSRYMLNVNVTLTPVDLPNNPNVFSRIELAANFADTEGRARIVLIPFNFNSREGGISQTEADNRCYTAAERRINEEFGSLLSDYLSKLMPRNQAGR